MKHALLFSIILSVSSFAHASKVSDFLEPIFGKHQLNGNGCGLITIDHTDTVTPTFNIRADNFSYLISDSLTDENVRITKNTLSLSYESTDNAWPNLKDWEKKEITIEKDKNGELLSIKYRSGWGKPFYLKYVQKYNCTR